jgi:hypothetical protein
MYKLWTEYFLVKHTNLSDLFDIGYAPFEIDGDTRLTVVYRTKETDTLLTCAWTVPMHSRRFDAVLRSGEVRPAAFIILKDNEIIDDKESLEHFTHEWHNDYEAFAVYKFNDDYDL